MSEYVQVIEDQGEEPVELPTEEDNTLLLSTLVAQFPGACGLKYRCKDSNGIRGIRLADGKLHPPEFGWKGNLYCCVFPKENKRKSDDNSINSISKTKKIESKLKCTDLIVLGLPWKITDEQLREYFETHGELLMSQVKNDPKTGQSKGYGFIRFADIESQMRVLAQRHLIGERWCDVKIPNSKDGNVPQMPSKVFVGRVTQDMTAQDLKDYFSEFGEVTDVFIPKPFRAFAFVTFLNPEVANGLCGEDHLIKGISVRTGMALPKHSENYSRPQGGYQGMSNRQSPMPMGGNSRNRDWDDVRMSSASPRANNSMNVPSGMGSMGGQMNMGGMSGQGGMGGQGNTDMQNVLLTAVNPMLVAALNQAGWGLMGQPQQGGQNSQSGQGDGGPNQGGGGNYGGWLNNQGPGGGGNANQQGMWQPKNKHDSMLKYN